MSVERKCQICGEFKEGISETVCMEATPEETDDCPVYHPDKKKIQARYPLLNKVPKNKKQWERAISVSFINTPKSLYRFLYLWEPKRMDFSDMYKYTLATIDLNGKGIVYLEFYKYQLAVYLYVPPAELKPRPGQAIEISCGVPGTETEEFIASLGCRGASKTPHGMRGYTSPALKRNTHPKKHLREWILG